MNIQIPDVLNIVEGHQKITPPYHHRYVVVTTEHLWLTYGSWLDITPERVIYKQTEEVAELNELYGQIPEDACLVAFGGGKTIDATKYLAARGDPTPYIIIPTALSNDGICSPIAVLQREGKQHRQGVHAPLAVVVPLSIVAAAPIKTTQAGVGDMFAKRSALRDWDLAHRERGEPLNQFAYILAEHSCNEVYDWFENALEYDEDADFFRSPDFLKALAKALLMCGIAMQITGNSRPCSGGEHLFSHVLDQLVPTNRLSHGAKVSFGTLLGLALDQPGVNVRRYQRVHRLAGLPTTWQELSLPKSVLIDAITRIPTFAPDRYTVFHHHQLTNQGAELLLARLS